MARVATLDVRQRLASQGRLAAVVQFIGSWGESLALVLLTLALRLWGISFGLPYADHPDEPVVFNTVAQMLQHHTLNPLTFTYPSALYYYFFAVGSLYQFIHGTTVGMAVGTVGVGTNTGVGQYTNPDALLWMRVGVALVCTAAILLVYFTARFLVGRWPAALASLLLAISSLHINLSQIATTDGPAATAMALVGALSVVAVRTERRGAFWLAWISVGLAAGVKYNAGASAIMPLAAYAVVVLRQAPPGQRPSIRELLTDWRLLGFLLVPLAFLVTSPYALREPRLFLHDVKAVALHYTVVGQLGQSGSSLLFTLQNMFSWPELLLSALACVGILSALRRRRWEVLVIAAGALVYFVIVATPKVFFLRNLVPLWPLLALLAAEGIAWLAILLAQVPDRALPPLRFLQQPSGRVAILSIVALVGLIPMVAGTIQFDHFRSSEDVRQVASEWITTYIPAGTSIADEAYGVTLDPHRYKLDFENVGLIGHPLSWYSEQGIQYAVASDIFFGRFFVSGSPFAAERVEYRAMFTQWTLVRTFVGVNVVGANYGAHIYLFHLPPPSTT